MEKALPQDIEAEEVVLGALIIEKEAYDRVSNMLTEECFYLSKHRLIYRAIDSLAKEINIPIIGLAQLNRVTEDNIYKIKL